MTLFRMAGGNQSGSPRRAPLSLIFSLQMTFSFFQKLLMPNIGKSKSFFSAGVPRRKISTISSITSIWSTSALDKYLGFSILKGRMRKDYFHFILDKLHDRLALWKTKLLNRAGRVTLAKSVLNSIPTYYMHLSWLPSSICNRIDQLTNQFIWKDSTGKGMHWWPGRGSLDLRRREAWVYGQLGRRTRLCLGNWCGSCTIAKISYGCPCCPANISTTDPSLKCLSALVPLFGIPLSKLETPSGRSMSSGLVMGSPSFGIPRG